MFHELYGLETVKASGISTPDGAPSTPRRPLCGGDPAVHRCFACPARPPEIHGDGTQSRDFTYVDDVVAANLAAVQAPASVCAGNAYNVAAGRACLQPAGTPPRARGAPGSDSSPSVRAASRPATCRTASPTVRRPPGTSGTIVGRPPRGFAPHRRLVPGTRSQITELWADLSGHSCLAPTPRRDREYAAGRGEHQAETDPRERLRIQSMAAPTRTRAPHP